MNIGDTFLHGKTETTRKVVEIIQKSSGVFYVVRESNTGEEYIVRPKNIGKDYFKPLDPSEIDFLVQHPDFRLNLTPILKSSAQRLGDLTTLKGIYRTTAGKMYYIDSEDAVLGRSDFFVPTSLPETETFVDYAETRFVFWEWHYFDDKVVAHSSGGDWKVEYSFENGALVMNKPESSRILVIPGQNSFKEADLCKIQLPQEFQYAPVTYKVHRSILDNEPVLYNMKSPCDSQESPRKNLIYMPADSTCPMDGGEMLDRSAVTLHARPWALFASSKGSRDMCNTNVFETERTLDGSWRAPDRGPSFGLYAPHYFLAWIRPHEVIIPYRNEFRLAIGQTKSGDLVVNRQLDLTTSKLCWLQDLVCVKNTKLYRNVSKSYEAPNGEVFKINNAYRVSFTDNSDKLENITFKAFADLDGITYGITKNHRAIDMQGIEVF